MLFHVVHHPANTDDDEMLQFLPTSLIAIENTDHACGFIVSGDFIRLTRY